MIPRKPVIHKNWNSSVMLSMEKMKETFNRLDFEFNWETKEGKFIEYEYEDKEWAEFFGFIKKRPDFRTLLASPAVAKKLRENEHLLGV